MGIAARFLLLAGALLAVQACGSTVTDIGATSGATSGSGGASGGAGGMTTSGSSSASATGVGGAGGDGLGGAAAGTGGAGASGGSSPNSHSLTLALTSEQGAVGPSTLALSLTGDLTLEAWVKPASPPVAGADYPIVGKYARVDGQRCYILTYTNTTGTLALGFAPSADGINFSYLQLPYALALGVWQHVAVAYQASTGTAEFFVDGISAGFVSGGPSTLNVADVGVTVGRFADANNPSTYWDGSVDEVRIWQTARTAVEVQSLRFVEVLGTEAGLVAAWHLDGDFADATPNGAQLAPTNGPGFTPDVPF